MSGHRRAAWAALGFFTRLPVPGGAGEIDDDAVRRSTAYAPIVGWLVGGIAGVVYVACAQVVPPFLASILAVTSAVWVTGALHEDGLADLCDGLGATRDRERALAIMRDPSVGAFGVIGLTLVLLTRVAAVAAVGRAAGPAATAVVLVAGHALSRVACVSLLTSERYARRRDEARSPALLEPLAPARLAWAASVGALPLIAFAPLGVPLVALAAIPALIAREGAALLLRLRLGGYTGDCLGAVQQLSEAAFYLGACALLAGAGA